MADSTGHDRDGYIEETLDNWTPRFVANGVDYSDLRRLQGEIETWRDWCHAFRGMGDEHEELGEEALGAGDDLGAGRHLARAAMYYHFGSHVWHVDADYREETHRRAVETFRRAGPLLDPPVERLEAPSGHGFDVPANLCVPEAGVGGTASPLVVLLPGSDSIKEELHWYAGDLHDRGLATLAVDGPAQGETWYHQGMTADYHEYVSAVLDHVEALDPDGVDVSRLGVLGVSLGGFYAPHVAANDGRFDGCVGISGRFAVGLVSNRPTALSREQYLWACKTDSLIEADDITEEMTLKGDIADLTAPTLVMTGALDTITLPEQTERIARHAPNAEFVCYPDGNHVCNNITYKARPATANWFVETIG